MEEQTPHARLVSERACDFAETLAALHELLGSTVTMWVLGARPDARQSAVTVCGPVTVGLELGEGNSAAVGIHIGGALLVVSDESLARASREEYVRLSDGARWTVLSLQFQGGAEVEIEQLPDD